MRYTKFEELPVWNAAVDLADKTFKLCEDKSFDFQGDLRKQLGKAALSVSNNIAEGFERHTTKELLDLSVHRPWLERRGSFHALRS